MFTRLLTQRQPLFAMPAITLLAFAASPVWAGCRDSLYGRPAYSANYPVYPVTAYPVTTAPAVTGYPTQISNPALTSGVVQAQRPATVSPTMVSPAMVYAYNNPSVYTGLPTAGMAPAQSSYRLPLAGTTAPVTSAPITTAPVNTVPVTTAPVTAMRPSGLQSQAGMTHGLNITAPPTANGVPIATTLRGNVATNPIMPTQAYSSYYGGTTPVVSSSVVSGPVVQTTYSPPVVVSPPPTPVAVQQTKSWSCGLSRFFNSCLGRSNTSYRTSYYRAPVTYYRPVTTVDPTLGTTVTVQQPCSSYVQQLQRTPVNSFLPLGSGTTVMPAAPACPTPPPSSVCGPTMAPSSSLPGSFSPSPSPVLPPSSIGQVGGQSIPGASGVTTIPSYPPAAGQALPPSTPPLTGSGNGSSGGIDPADRANVGQPQLEANRPNTDESKDTFGQSFKDDSYKSYSAPEEKEQADDESVDPFAGADEASEESNSKSDSPIRLTPPVTTAPFKVPSNGSNPGLIRNDQHFTATPPVLPPSGSLTTPKSLESNSSVAQGSASQEYSSLRPIGASEDFTPPFQDNFQPREKEDEKVYEPLPPVLPPPVASGSNYRKPGNYVTVPVREATATTHRSRIQQVSAWEEIPETKAPVVRDKGDWRPAR